MMFWRENTFFFLRSRRHRPAAARAQRRPRLSLSLPPRAGSPCLWLCVVLFHAVPEEGACACSLSGRIRLAGRRTTAAPDRRVPFLSLPPRPPPLSCPFSSALLPLRSRAGWGVGVQGRSRVGVRGGVGGGAVRAENAGSACGRALPARLLPRRAGRPVPNPRRERPRLSPRCVRARPGPPHRGTPFSLSLHLCAVRCAHVPATSARREKKAWALSRGAVVDPAAAGGRGTHGGVARGQHERAAAGGPRALLPTVSGASCGACVPRATKQHRPTGCGGWKMAGRRGAVYVCLCVGVRAHWLGGVRSGGGPCKGGGGWAAWRWGREGSLRRSRPAHGSGRHSLSAHGLCLCGGLAAPCRPMSPTSFKGLLPCMPLDSPTFPTCLACPRPPGEGHSPTTTTTLSGRCAPPVAPSPDCALLRAA
jgi:hypothetical protein